MAFIKSTMLLTIMFLFCTFNVHGSNQIVESRLMQKEGLNSFINKGDIDPMVEKCFKPFEDILMKLQEKAKNNPNAKPTKEDAEEIIKEITEALECLERNASTDTQKQAVQDLKKVQEELKVVAEKLDACIKNVGEEKAKEQCAKEEELVNEKMEELIKRASALMLEFIKDPKKRRLMILLQTFGFRVVAATQAVAFLVNSVNQVADFAFELVAVNVQFFAELIKNGAGCVWDGVKAIYGCVQNWWWKGKKDSIPEEVAEPEFYDCLDDLDKDVQLKEVFNEKEGEVVWYDAKEFDEATESKLAIEPIKKESTEVIAVNALTETIIEDLRQRLVSKYGKVQPTIDQIKSEVDEIRKDLNDKFNINEEQKEKITWMISKALSDYINRQLKPTNSAFKVIDKMRSDNLHEMIKAIFHGGKQYLECVQEMNDSSTNILKELEQVDDGDLSKDERTILKQMKEAFKGTNGEVDVEKMFADLQKEMKFEL